jgi:hypothetical protein
LVEHLSDFTSVEVGLEAPNTGLTEASELLGEVKSLVNGREWVVICALGTLVKEILRVMW